jgi:mannose-1-phosphate guanylyltransferase
MEAIILAGGFGTRLRPLTYTRAKSLLPILNRPMITYLIDMLPKEVDKVVLAVNYRKKQIEEFFESYDCGKEIIVNDEPKPLGTGGAVKFAEKHITDRFFVLNSDIICSLNLDEMIRFHTNQKATSTISLWPVENVSEFGVVEIKNNGNITRFVEKPRPQDAPSNLINAGAYLLEPFIFDYIKPGELISMEKEIFPQIIRDTNRFYGYQFKGYWMDIGRIGSYLDVHEFILKRRKLVNLIGDNCTTQKEIRGSTLGNNVVIGKGSSVISSIIFDNAIIQENVHLDHCVIGENGVVGKKSKLHYTVVGDNEKLPPESNCENEPIWTQPIPQGYPKKQIGNVIGE